MHIIIIGGTYNIVLLFFCISRTPFDFFLQLLEIMIFFKDYSTVLTILSIVDIFSL